jgi:hypothetical protein
VLRLIKNVEWKHFVDLLSPRFFDVVPMSTALVQARRLGGNYFDTKAFAAARAARGEALKRDEVAVQLVDALSSPPARVESSTVLELYFHQVLRGGTVLLDLRAECSRWLSSSIGFTRSSMRARPAVNTLHFLMASSAGWNGGLLELVHRGVNLGRATRVERRPFHDQLGHPKRKSIGGLVAPAQIFEQVVQHVCRLPHRHD